MSKGKRKKKSFFIIVGIIVLLLYSFIVFDNNLKPTLLALSEIKAKSIATQSINKAIQEKMNEDIKYKDLIYINYDDSGNVTSMQANTILMNKIASDVALKVQDQIKKVEEAGEKEGGLKVKIPLGNAINSPILSQKGPKINVKIIPKGSVKVDFATEFEESGINQTIHRVFLIIKTSVRIIVPLGADTVQITSTVPIAETIIVGDVPQSYVNIPKEDLTNIIPGI